MQLVFATNNRHKLKEVIKLLPSNIELLSLQDIDCVDELPETGNTLEQNAKQKAMYVHEKFGMDCFADDTGLEVKILGNRPGVYSARYAGVDGNSENNIQKLLIEMKNETERSARFRTCIVLLLNHEEHIFEGVIEGKIGTEPVGTSGFGYDPVFIPNGFEKTFAEMTLEEKNLISHRAKAILKLTDWIRQNLST